MSVRSTHDLELDEGKPTDTQTSLLLLLILLKDYEPSKLERKFAGSVPDPTLKSLLHVIEGLMRFLPSSRLTADNALDLLGNGQE